jgi:hypothetical protein
LREIKKESIPNQATNQSILEKSKRNPFKTIKKHLQTSFSNHIKPNQIDLKWTPQTTHPTPNGPPKPPPNPIFDPKPIQTIKIGPVIEKTVELAPKNRPKTPKNRPKTINFRPNFPTFSKKKSRKYMPKIDQNPLIFPLFNHSFFTPNSRKFPLNTVPKSQTLY